ncbi:MAG: sporulation initiation factor Spo0A C-terminal domain-containing protein, partial [Ruminococcus sp.]|nr:sporulation initiation factor Spo0A C-terminal domain-containing protein [Ruminococcus sp.]
MIDLKSKMLIGSQSIVGAKLAAELSETGIYTVTRRELSAEMLEKNNAVLIDNTADDIDEALETLILSGNTNAKIFVLTSETAPLLSDKNGVLFISEKLGTENICVLLRYFFDAENACKQTEKATSKILLYMGFQANLKGYRYLIEMISAIVGNPELIYSFVHELYPIIAEKHNVTSLSGARAKGNWIGLAYD